MVCVVKCGVEVEVEVEVDFSRESSVYRDNRSMRCAP